MDQAALQKAADLHPRPEVWSWLTCPVPILKDGLRRRIRLVGVVIGDGNLLQPHGEGLVGQLFGPQASITTNGVAMEVETPWTAPRSHLPQDGGEGMVQVALGPGLTVVGEQRDRTH
jgi:hypothetical protein